MAHIPFNERLWCSVAGACAAAGEGRTRMFGRIASGQIASKKEGSRRLVSVQSLLQHCGERTDEVVDASEERAKLAESPKAPKPLPFATVPKRHAISLANTDSASRRTDRR